MAVVHTTIKPSPPPPLPIRVNPLLVDGLELLHAHGGWAGVKKEYERIAATAASAAPSAADPFWSGVPFADTVSRVLCALLATLSDRSQYVAKVSGIEGVTQEMAARCAFRAAGDYRFLVVTGILEHSLTAVRAAEAFEKDRPDSKTSGSTDVTSDLDMTVVGEGGEMALALANELFALMYAKFGYQTMATLFDSNLYTQAVLNSHMRVPSFSSRSRKRTGLAACSPSRRSSASLR
jgi:hypothetical protein